MLKGWKFGVLIRSAREANSKQVHYLAAIPEEKAAKRAVARLARVSIQCVESIAPIDDEMLLDFGLNAGDVAPINIVR